MRPLVFCLAAVAYVAGASPAFAQQFPFEGWVDAAGLTKLDISTMGGTIAVHAGEADRVRITAVVTVRVAWDTPANAVEIAQQVAKAPPIERDGSTLRLRPPSDPAQRRAAIVSYQVRIPPGLEVETNSDSGATTMSGLAGPVRVHTESAAIEISSLKGPVSVTTGSGAVTADDIAGAFIVTTSSSGLTARRIGASLQVRTGSGEVDAELSGTGDVDVETSSSAVKLRGLKGGLVANTQSGRVTVEGVPQQPWMVTTGSSSVEITLPPRTGLSIDAESRSGEITIEGADIKGSTTKQKVEGTVGAGGPLLRVRTGSGSIRIGFAPR